MLLVLPDRAAIHEAHRALVAARLHPWRSARGRLVQAAFVGRFRARPPRLTWEKSWDAWHAVRVVLEHVPERNARVVDVGSYASAVPMALGRAGYRCVVGVDLDPRGRYLRWAGLEFRREDFLATSLPAGSADVVTAMSVVEHGMDPRWLLAGVARLLRPGGLFVLSTDYRAEKLVVPADVRLFGQPWTVFDRAEVERMVDAAGDLGLAPLGPVAFDPSEDPVAFLGLRFTFALAAFRRVATG